MNPSKVISFAASLGTGGMFHSQGHDIIKFSVCSLQQVLDDFPKQYSARRGASNIEAGKENPSLRQGFLNLAALRGALTYPQELQFVKCLKESWAP